MYELSIQREFCAAHAIVMNGVREPIHGHTWRVRAVVGGPELDDDGLLCDFHLLEARLDRVLTRLHNVDLNATPPFDRINPTAEHVARHIADAMAADLPAGIVVRRISVVEAPGCEATFVVQGTEGPGE